MREILNEHILKILDLSEIDFNLNKDKNYVEINNEILKEKMHILNTYYDFTDNEDCLSFLSKSYDLIKDDFNIKIKKEDRLVLLIIILKSFLEKKNISNSYEKYTNSDEIFNYVYDQYNKYMLDNKVYLSKRNTKVTILYTLSILCEKKILLNKKITIKGESFKTYIYYGLEIKNYERHPFSFFNFSYVEFSWLEVGDKYYITNLHYSKTHEVNKNNFKSDKVFKIKDKKYIISKINLKLYIDEEFQEDLRAINKKEVGVIKENIKQKNEILNLLFEKDLWYSNTKEELSNIQRELTILNTEIINITFCNFNFGDDYIIFPLFMDFRGRKYYSSVVGPTNSKMLRLSYYYGYYDKNFFKEEGNIYCLDHLELIEFFLSKYNYNYDKKYYESVFWCLISIGKFFVNKEEYPINVSVFIEKAISNYDNQNLKLDDLVELKHYKRIIESFQKEKIKKRSLVKDATASINQIFMKKLGPINQKSLDYVNLGNENLWYDTYLVHRDKFIDSLGLCANSDMEFIRGLLKRKLIKSTIMTIPYSAGFKLCWDNYIKTIKEEKYDIEITKKVKDLYKKFYIFVKKDMQSKYLYKKNTQSLLDKINENFEEMRKMILESDTGEADISYYKMKKSSIDKKYLYNGVSKRITKLVLVPTSAIDIQAFNISSGANTAHFLDADEVRSIELGLGYVIITIHDSFLIDFGSCSRLVEVKIQHYQKIIEKFNKNFEIKNIFILL